MFFSQNVTPSQLQALLGLCVSMLVCVADASPQITVCADASCRGERVRAPRVLLRLSLTPRQTFNCGGRGRRGGSSPCCCELGGWEPGQVLIPSPGTAGPSNCHLFVLTVHT